MEPLLKLHNCQLSKVLFKVIAIRSQKAASSDSLNLNPFVTYLKRFLYIHDSLPFLQDFGLNASPSPRLLDLHNGQNMALAGDDGLDSMRRVPTAVALSDFSS